MSASESEMEDYVFKEEEKKTTSVTKPTDDEPKASETNEPYKRSPNITESMWNVIKAKELYPIQLVFKHLNFSVTEMKKKGKNPFRKVATEKKILKDVSGSVEPGELLAIMGASGAGKTTLLNLLAGRAVGKIEGDILFNGNSREDATSFLRKTSAYIMQDDLMLKTQTPEEILTFAARLRIGNELTDEQKLKRVETIIEELNLQKCRHTQVGAPGVQRGISGGERKRVAIGTELLNNPSLLFVDEPTTGLDSFTAENVMSTLRDLAKSGRTIISTIHQPNSQIFQLFDKLLLLAQGQPIYFGPAKDAVKYFKSIGYSCPPYSNPADYFIEICNFDQTNPEESQKRIDGLIAAYRSSQMLTAQENVVVNKIDPPKNNFTHHGYPQSTLTQLGLITKRGFSDHFREPLKIRASLIQTIVLSIIMGLIYLKISKNQQSSQDRQGALFFLCVNSSMSALTLLVNLFPQEKPLFLREVSNFMYRPLAFYISKVMTDLPFQMLYPAILGTILYWMVGLQAAASNYFILIAAVVLVANVAAAIGLCISIGAKDSNSAFAMVPLVLLPFMIFSGFFLNSNDVPKYFIWIEALSFLKYAFVILVRNEFEDLTFTCTSSELIPIPGSNGTATRCPLINGEQTINFLGFQDDPIWREFVILASMWTFYRILGYFLLRLKTRRANA